MFCSLAITSRCNNTCKYCSLEKNRGDLPFPLIEKAIKDLPKNTVFQITGGEPFLRKDLQRIVKKIRETGGSSSIFTSGENVNKETAHKVKKFIEHIKVSLDSTKEELNDEIRGKGSFKKAVTAIKILGELKINCKIVSTITKLNYTEIPYLVELAKRLSARGIYINHFIPPPDYLDLNEKEFQCVLELLKSLENVGDIEITTNFLPYKEYAKKIKISECRAPFISIRPDGSIQPCPSLPIKIGYTNMNGNVMDLWNNSRIIRRIEENSINGLNGGIERHRGCYAYDYYKRHMPREMSRCSII